MENQKTAVPEDLANDASQLRETLSSLDQLKEWFKSHAHVLGEIPEELLSQVEVEIQEHGSSLDTLVSKKAIWFNVILDVKRTKTNPLETVLSLVRDKDNTIYSRFYHMPMSFDKWPICTAWLAYEYFGGDFHPSYEDPVETKLKKYLAKFFPKLTMETLKQLHAADLLPKNRDEFAAYMIRSRVANELPSHELPGNLHIAS